jgi:hypothetical protein
VLEQGSSSNTARLSTHAGEHQASRLRPVTSCWVARKPVFGDLASPPTTPVHAPGATLGTSPKRGLSPIVPGRR